MVYSLGNVKPHVKAAANEVGPKYGIKTIYGFSFRNIAGTNTLSDHARGLALDFMTNDPAARSGVAEYGRANAQRLGVTYIIHDRKIWSTSRNSEGWRPYSGVNPHTDHTHMSFAGSAGSGPVVDVGGQNASVIPGVDEARQLMAVAQAFNRAGNWLSDSHNWLRIGLFLVGAILVLGGTIGIQRALGAVQTTAKGVSNAASQS